MRGFFTFVVGLLAIGHLAFFATGCERRSSDGERGTAEGRLLPNVLLLTLDTTRADRLGCYGYRDDVSPCLDRLASGGIRLTRARSQVPITLPSHVSMFTGTYPVTHGIHQHVDRFGSAGIPTLAEILQEQGYQTSAFIASRVLDAKFGLDRGFAYYGDDMGLTADGRQIESRRANRITQEAQDWFQRRPAGPYFAWLHFYDPHLTYDPPEPFRSRFAKDLYAGEIAFMDAQIDAFLQWLQTRGELANTIVVAIADHGESLGEHDIFGHTEYVYQEVLHIPFLMSWPGHLPGGFVSDAVVRTVDLMPTLLDLLDLEIPRACVGRSLRPLWSGRGRFSPEPSLFESRYLENLFGWAPLEGVERWPHKFIRAPQGELYDLSSDPAESQNLYDSLETTRMELELLLDDLLEVNQPTAVPTDTDIEIDEQTRQSLASLGYVSTSARSRRNGAAVTDPKDHRVSVRLYQQVMMGPDQNSTPADLDRVRQLAHLEPQQPTIQELLGDYLVHFGNFVAADTAYHEAASLAAANPGPFLKLAGLARLAGEDQRARTQLAEAYRVDPQDAKVLFEMAEQSARDQDYQQAERYYRQALEQRPEYVPALGHLAALLMLLGRRTEAEPLLRRSLELPRESNQELAQRHYHLGIVLLEDVATRSEAVGQFLQAVDLSPQLAGPHYQLARLFAGEGDKAEAAEHARKYLALDPESPRATQMRTLVEDF